MSLELFLLVFTALISMVNLWLLVALWYKNKKYE